MVPHAINFARGMTASLTTLPTEVVEKKGYIISLLKVTSAFIRP
jgi:hypothetical protein